MSQDREFENYMKGKSGLSDLYADLPQDKLPSHLDAAILAEAHRAVGARPGGKPRRNWVIPLSMAASLFVVVIIGLQLPYLIPVSAVPGQMRQEEKHQEEPPQQEKQGAAKMEMAGADRSAPVPAAPAKVTPEQKQRRAQASDQPEIPPAETAVAPPAKAATSLNSGAPQRVSPEPAPMMAKPGQAFDKKPVGAISVAPAAPAEAPPVAAEKPSRLYEQAESGNRPELKKEQRVRSRADGSTADYSAQPAATAGTIVAAPEPAGLASEPQVKDKADMANLRPKEWLARIRELKKQGKPDEAKKELAAFRKHYPDYPVPKDMEIR